MIAEILCVGTELLLGEILNSNAQFLAQELAQLGIAHHYQTVVGDNPERLHKAIAIACDRASLLIFTGGLGPTPDDLTTEGIAAHFGAELQEDPAIVADITEKFANRGREMTANNLKQALIPVGAAIIPNPLGTAPGILWTPRENVTLMTFPGVPREMKRMWQDTAVPYLRSQGAGQTIFHSRVLRFWGIGESHLASQVNHLFDRTNPTVAPYAGQGEVRLRITARAATIAEAEALIAPIATEIQAIAGSHYYGQDEDTLSRIVGNLLQQHHQTLAIAESCTGGGLGSSLTAIAGSSSYFLGGAIAYANTSKIKMLGVNGEDLERAGAVSGIIAEQMARGIQQNLGSDWALSITGIAGPEGGSPEKPVGLVYIGLAHPNGKTEHFEHHFGANQQRDYIRHLSSQSALNHLRLAFLTNL